jgi:hypothetical protein
MTFRRLSMSDHSDEALRLFSDTLTWYCRELRHAAEQTRRYSALCRQRAEAAARVSKSLQQVAKADRIGGDDQTAQGGEDWLVLSRN